MKDVIYRPEADADLEGIWAYTLENWGLQHSLKYSTELTTGASKDWQPARQLHGVLRRSGQVCGGRRVVFFWENAEAVTVARVV